MVKLSIIIPVYNISEYVDRCLYSICCQLLDEIEILVIDDESPDDSISKVLLWQKKYKCIRIISQKNKGLGGARNTGIREATGKFLWFVDGDDEIKRDSLWSILRYVDLLDDDVIVFDYERLNSVAKVIGRSFSNIDLHSIDGYTFEKNILLVQAWRSLYKRSFLIENNLFFREHFLHEDCEFNMRILCYAKKMTYVDEVIYRYFTQNGGSIMNSICIKNMENLISIFDTADFIKKKFLNSHKINTITNIYLRHVVAIMFSNSCNLSTDEFWQFRLLLYKNKHRIKKLWSVKEVGMYRIVLNYLQLYFPSKIIYNIIYNKNIIRSVSMKVLGI